MRHEDVKEQNKLKFSILPAAIRREHCFATLSENMTITSDAFIGMSSYFDMSNLSFAA